MESLTTLIHRQTAVDEIQLDLAMAVPRWLSMARALGVPAMVAWLQGEVSGYNDGHAVPAYRLAPEGTLITWMPGNGWAQVPFDVPEGDAYALRQSLAEVLEIHHKQGKRTGITLKAVGDEQLRLQKQCGLRSEIAVSVPVKYFDRIPDVLTASIHFWTEELIALGVQGHGLSFSGEEKMRAAATNEKVEAYQSLALEIVDGRMAKQPVKTSLFGKLFGR